MRVWYPSSRVQYSSTHIEINVKENFVSKRACGGFFYSTLCAHFFFFSVVYFLSNAYLSCARIIKCTTIKQFFVFFMVHMSKRRGFTWRFSIKLCTKISSSWSFFFLFFCIMLQEEITLTVHPAVPQWTCSLELL